MEGKAPRGMRHGTFQELGHVATSEAGSGAAGQQGAVLCWSRDGEAVRGLQEEVDNGNRTVSILCCHLPCGKAERG